MRVISVLRELAALIAAASEGVKEIRRLVRRDAGNEDTNVLAAVRANAAPQLGDDFLLATSIGFNRQLLANIDAIDTALIGILGATVAFAVLTVDKIKELRAWPCWTAITFLAVSGLLSFAGYASGFIRGEPIEVPRPALFVPDFARYGSKAIARALHAAVAASEHNRRIRTQKRLIALVAIAFLIGGALVVGYARLRS